MRAVMQEMIFLLGVAGINDLYFHQSPQNLQLLTYEDFASLRPQYSASSWRGIAAKLVADRLIIKTLKEGKTAFQITLLGMETFSSFFPFLQDTQADTTWSLCLLKHPQKRPALWVEARRMLQRRGYHSVFPQVFLKFQSDYDGGVAQDLIKMGFFVSFLAVNSSQMQPMRIDDLLEGTLQQDLSLQRKLMDLSKQIDRLLVERKKEKDLSSKEKQKIGTLLLSGLHILKSIPPGWNQRSEHSSVSSPLVEKLALLSQKSS